MPMREWIFGSHLTYFSVFHIQTCPVLPQYTGVPQGVVWLCSYGLVNSLPVKAAQVWVNS